MALWSVALFGHYKPNFEVRGKKLTAVTRPMGYRKGRVLYGEVLVNLVVSKHIEEPQDIDLDQYFVYRITGNEKRAKPGDIVSVKPIERANTWTLTEKKHFLIVTIADLEKDNLPGTVEPYWDISDYPEDKGRYEYFLHPYSYLQKRRFGFSIKDLKDMNIDTSRMLDKEDDYVPQIEAIKKIDIFDKVNVTRVSKDAELRLIDPVIYNPEKNPRIHELVAKEK